MRFAMCFFFFFFNDTATTEIYTLSLHDALPISSQKIGEEMYKKTASSGAGASGADGSASDGRTGSAGSGQRSEEHTSELQSRLHLVCRLLLEKKKKKKKLSQVSQLSIEPARRAT